MKKLHFLLLLSSSILLSCNRRNINPNRVDDSDSFRYEVISTNNWNGTYVASDGGTRQVQNKQSGWSYSGLPKFKPFTAHLFVQPTEHPTELILHIYHNNVLAAADTITTDRSYNNAVLTYVIH